MPSIDPGRRLPLHIFRRIVFEQFVIFVVVTRYQKSRGPDEISRPADKVDARVTGVFSISVIRRNLGSISPIQDKRENNFSNTLPVL